MHYQRCADLHNEILRRGWTGSGQHWVQPQTWWENQAPSEETASHLSPSLIEFLKRAYCIPNSPQPFFFFYFLDTLNPIEWIVSNGFLEDTEEDRHPWGWLPLEAILEGYLEMIDEGKVIPVPYRESAYFEMSSGPIRVPPWEMHLYTATDVQKAVSALKRLVNAIEIRLDHQTQSPAAFTPLPWHDPAAFSEQLVPPSTFAYDFLKAISELKIRFRYIAPGIRLPTLSEFLSQSWRGGGSHTLRIFQIQLDDSTRLDPPDKSNPKSPGLYIEQVKPGGEYHFANECRLELPFRVGANGFARQSTGHPLGFNIEDLHPKPEGSRWELYQSGFPTGFTDIRFVQIHKVLLNWAEMVERRDWDVDVDGVTGGIEKFREADTEEHWEKYWIPHSW